MRLYVCGLTPSAEAHLGHARSFLFFDVLYRYMQHCGFRVTYARNVTDVDDRSIAEAQTSGRPWHEIVAGYEASFQRSMQRLGVRSPDLEPHATQFVPQIVSMIAALIERGYAYVAKDGVYYRVSKFDRYGDLSNRKIDELEAGARVEVDESKDDPLDFALWKFAKPGEPHWPSPWGDGRPGWHIECSAMSRELLDPDGIGFEIHGGGADLIFPHHENEIAQSEPLMAHPPMAKVWMHGGLLLFDGRKMSKSLGNFEPLSKLLDRHDPQAIRLLFLQTGYRKVMNFTEESVAAATTTLRKLQSAWRRLRPEPAPAKAAPGRGPLIAKIESALDDDMNTALAVSEVLRHASDSQALEGSQRAGAFADLGYGLGLLGIEPGESWDAEPTIALSASAVERLRAAFPDELGAGSVEDGLERIVRSRDLAREARDWKESDRIRDTLASCGIVLADSKDGTTWNAAE